MLQEWVFEGLLSFITVWTAPASFPHRKCGSAHARHAAAPIVTAGRPARRPRAGGRSRRAQTWLRSRGRTCSETPPWNQTVLFNSCGRRANRKLNKAEVRWLSCSVDPSQSLRPSAPSAHTLSRCEPVSGRVKKAARKWNKQGWNGTIIHVTRTIVDLLFE